MSDQSQYHCTQYIIKPVSLVRFLRTCSVKHETVLFPGFERSNPATQVLVLCTELLFKKYEHIPGSPKTYMTNSMTERTIESRLV